MTLVTLLKTRKDYKTLLDFVEPLMQDPAREVHQGAGWFLRELWKLDPKLAERFLLRYKDTAPRLIFQYATEKMTAEQKAMMEAYGEYYAAAKTAMRAGATCHDVHTAVSKGFADRGYHLGHVTGHSIGMTMIEFPKVGEGVETELAENMVLSMHPHAIAANGEDCLYMQDTWLVTADGGVPLADLALRVWER